MRSLNGWPRWCAALKQTVSWSRVAWFWLVVLLVLPNCSLDRRGIGSGTNLYPGSTPRSSVIFCDIERNAGRHCASPEELATGIPLTAAAVALVTGQSSNIGIDKSADALTRCPDGEAVTFQGPFPRGTNACLNCNVIEPGSPPPTPLYADVNVACVKKCEDVFSPDGPVVPAPAAVVTFCEAHARASTNFPINGCFEDACTTDGALRADFVDPRRNPEAVVWADLIGVSAAANSLTRTAVTTGGGTADFNAGASTAQDQWAYRGDTYVEFSASEIDKSHVIGLTTGCASLPCPPDADPSLSDIAFSISLNSDGRFYILEGGAVVAGPDLNTSWGTYSVGQRFRVTAKQNADGTASIAYSRIIGVCTAGSPCAETVFNQHVGPGVSYPLRVDASFREQGATLSDVRIVRIK